jgi:acetoin utilization deacetylase AcuC-like enzyme
MSDDLPFLALVDDERFDAHTARGPHPERPERLAAARDGLRSAVAPDRLRPLEARPATEAELLAVHRGAYLSDLGEALRGGWGHLDADTFFSPASREAAWHAAGGAAELAGALMAERGARGLALLRPPGHHAEADRAMGFCLLNNVALAARAARAAGAARVAIVDWDVHHGNGTQHVFEREPDVLFLSLHEWPLYPGTGRPTELGRGAGLGRTANLALPSGSGDESYAHAFRRVVLPLLAAHRPDLILVSAGYDAHARDPLASMALSAEGYGAMATALVDAAEALGHGRVGFVLEGGYDLSALEASVAATARAALGERTELPEDRPPSAAVEVVEQVRARLAEAWGAAWPGEASG